MIVNLMFHVRVHRLTRRDRQGIGSFGLFDWFLFFRVGSILTFCWSLTIVTAFGCWRFIRWLYRFTLNIVDKLTGIFFILFSIGDRRWRTSTTVYFLRALWWEYSPLSYFYSFGKVCFSDEEERPIGRVSSIAMDHVKRNKQYDRNQFLWIDKKTNITDYSRVEL